MFTQYYLHAPKSSSVFATRSHPIAAFLHRRHNWVTTKTDRKELPGYISTSCIRESPDGETVIDQDVLDGPRRAQAIKRLLIRDGFAAPDVTYVGVLVEIRGEGQRARW